MTEAPTLDTYRMVKRLVGRGMPEQQAETVVDFVRERHEEAVTREVLRYELALLEERLSERLDGLEQRVTSLDKDLTTCLAGMLAAAVALVGALVAIF